MIDTEYRRRVVDRLGLLLEQGGRVATALERIADALEAARIDPVDVIERVAAGLERDAAITGYAEGLLDREHAEPLPDDEAWRLR